MTTPTLYVLGRAGRLVMPDRVVVSVAVRTPVLPSPQEALAVCAAARRRLLDHLHAACPDSAIADGRIATEPDQHRVTTELAGRREERWEVRGYSGACVVTIEDDASAAGAIVAAAGSHPDAERTVPRFAVGPELARRSRAELEEEAIRDALARAQGLAGAAGLRVGPVLSIGEPEPERPSRGEPHALYAMADPSSPRELEDELGELRPEPERFDTAMPVRLALLPHEA